MRSCSAENTQSVHAQALGDAGETVAAYLLRRRENGRDALHQRCQPGGAAGEVQRVDTLAAARPACRSRGVGGIDDALQVAA